VRAYTPRSLKRAWASAMVEMLKNPTEAKRRQVLDLLAMELPKQEVLDV